MAASHHGDAILRQTSHIRIGYPIHHFRGREPILTGLGPVQQPHPPILIGGQGSRGIGHTVAYGDGWMPIVYPELDFAPQMQELERRCQAVGRPAAPVTTAQWEIDEPLMEQCAGLGVDRCLVVYHAEDQDNFPAFLERCSRLVDRLR